MTLQFCNGNMLRAILATHRNSHWRLTQTLSDTCGPLLIRNTVTSHTHQELLIDRIFFQSGNIANLHAPKVAFGSQRHEGGQVCQLAFSPLGRRPKHCHSPNQGFCRLSTACCPTRPQWNFCEGGISDHVRMDRGCD